MTSPQMHINDVLTGETITRDLTVAESTELKAVFADEKIYLDKIAADAQARATARQALLDKLGITADEAKLLLG
jgi:hypothetical protein